MGVQKRQLKNGDRYRYYGSIKGEKYCSPAIYLSKEDAERAENEYRAEVLNNVTALSQVMKLRVKDLTRENKGFNYVRATECYFDRAKEVWGDVEIEKVDRGMVRDLLNRESERFIKDGQTNHAVNGMLRALRALFNYAIIEKNIGMVNPTRGIKMYPVTVDKYIPRIDEIDRVYKCFDEEEKKLFQFVDQSACRIMEAIRLNVKDVSAKQVRLWTRKSKNQNLMPRFIPKPKCMRTWKLPKTGRVFYRWIVNPRFLANAVDKVQASGVDMPSWNWHNLRHRRASIWASRGMPLLKIMTYLGHTNIDTTQKYLKLLGCGWSF